MTSALRAVSRVVFVRHGQTDYNSGGRVQGQIDIALNEVGRAQARAMGPVVARMNPTLIVSSDLSRARDTAAEIQKHSGGELVLDERLRERAFGSFEGMNYDELVSQHPIWYREWKETGESLSAGVEPRDEVGKRFVSAISDMVSREAGTYVFVSHGSAITQAMTRLLGLSPHEWAGFRGPNNCHWSIMDQTVRAPYWRVIAHNIGLGDDIDQGASRS